MTPPSPAASSPAWARWLPGLQGLLLAGPGDVRADLAAGLSLTAVLLPVGVAYAVASGLPALQGLYASLAALLAYALFGPNRVLVLGPDSSLVALTLAVVLPLAGGDPARAVALAGAMALVAGGVCVAAGLARLGFVTELLSKPIRLGYMNGIALTVVVSQLPVLLGTPVQADGLWAGLPPLLAALSRGDLHLAAVALGLGTLLALLLLKRLPRVPGVLLAVVAATVCTAWLGLDGQAGVVVLGDVPQGLPLPAWPSLQLADLQPVLLGGLAIALVAFADTSVLSRGFAVHHGGRVDANQEMRALGAANLAAGLLQGMPVSASASRSSVALAAGARSQRAGLVAALAIVLVLLLAPGVLRHLPQAALAAVVMVSAAGLVDVAALRRLYRLQRGEFWLSIGCLAAVAVLGVLAGIALAVVAAVVEFLWDAWRPHSAVLGRVPGLRGYHDASRHPDAQVQPGLLLFRWDAPLFFANAEFFRERVQQVLADAPQPVRWLVVEAEPVTRVDVTAADMLDELERGLAAAGVTLCVAELKGPVKDTLRRHGLLERWGEQRFFRTMDEAVEHWQAHERDFPPAAPAAVQASSAATPVPAGDTAHPRPR